MSFCAGAKDLGTDKFDARDNTRVRRFVCFDAGFPRLAVVIDACETRRKFWPLRFWGWLLREAFAPQSHPLDGLGRLGGRGYQDDEGQLGEKRAILGTLGTMTGNLTPSLPGRRVAGAV